MTLRADDGTPLVAKEAIVLDTEGRPIVIPQEAHRTFGSAQIRTFKLKGWMVPLAVVAGMGLLTVGTVFIGALFAVFLGFWVASTVIKTVTRSLS